MYPLLPWKWLSVLLTFAIGMAIYADKIGPYIGISVTDQHVVRYLPPILLGVLAGFFAPTGYWAPWRIVWRAFPILNHWVPDINGIWVGSTASNWPTIKLMLDAAQQNSSVTKSELHSTAEQVDAMAIKIVSSLFKIRIEASLSSTGGCSYSILAKPYRNSDCGRIQIAYIYQQSSPDPAITDEETHMGSANIVIDVEDINNAKGVYWTRRNWKIGLNTAGHLNIYRVAKKYQRGKTLRQYAADEKDRLIAA